MGMYSYVVPGLYYCYLFCVMELTRSLLVGKKKFFLPTGISDEITNLFVTVHWGSVFIVSWEMGIIGR